MTTQTANSTAEQKELQEWIVTGRACGSDTDEVHVIRASTEHGASCAFTQMVALGLDVPYAAHTGVMSAEPKNSVTITSIGLLADMRRFSIKAEPSDAAFFIHYPFPVESEPMEAISASEARANLLKKGELTPEADKIEVVRFGTNTLYLHERLIVQLANGHALEDVDAWEAIEAQKHYESVVRQPYFAWHTAAGDVFAIESLPLREKDIIGTLDVKYWPDV